MSYLLGVHVRTLYNWEKDGVIDAIRTPGNKRLYNIDNYVKLNNINIIDNDVSDKLNISYARVSSRGQKDDLENQKKLLMSKYSNNMLIEDIGSGINLNRRGIRKIIKLGIEGKINEVVVVHKDRLTRYGFDLIEFLIKEYSGGKIVVLENKSKLGIEMELENDVLELMNVYVARRNGLRKYKLSK